MDDKIVAVSVRDPAFADYTDKSQLPQHLLREVRRFFDDYKVLEHKQVVVEDLLGPREAVEDHSRSARDVSTAAARRARQALTMIPALRAAFNAAWTETRFQAFRHHLESHVGVPVEFPVSETPCFFPQPLIDELASAGTELIHQSLSGDARRAAKRLCPIVSAGPGSARPTFLQVDFGLVRGEGGRLEQGSSSCRRFLRFTRFRRRSPMPMRPRSSCRPA